MKNSYDVYLYWDDAIDGDSSGGKILVAQFKMLCDSLEYANKIYKEYKQWATAVIVEVYRQEKLLKKHATRG